MTKAYVAETSCISCYWFCYVSAPACDKSVSHTLEPENLTFVSMFSHIFKLVTENCVSYSLKLCIICIWLRHPADPDCAQDGLHETICSVLWCTRRFFQSANANTLNAPVFIWRRPMWSKHPDLFDPFATYIAHKTNLFAVNTVALMLVITGNLGCCYSLCACKYIYQCTQEWSYSQCITIIYVTVSVLVVALVQVHKCLCFCVTAICCMITFFTVAFTVTMDCTHAMCSITLCWTTVLVFGLCTLPIS